MILMGFKNKHMYSLLASIHTHKELIDRHALQNLFKQHDNSWVGLLRAHAPYGRLIKQEATFKLAAQRTRKKGGVPLWEPIGPQCLLLD